jgi:hypothetical protein
VIGTGQVLAGKVEAEVYVWVGVKEELLVSGVTRESRLSHGPFWPPSCHSHVSQASRARLSSSSCFGPIAMSGYLSRRAVPPPSRTHVPLY